jgi:hypothetical protein
MTVPCLHMQAMSPVNETEHVPTLAGHEGRRGSHKFRGVAPYLIRMDLLTCGLLQ